MVERIMGRSLNEIAKAVHDNAVEKDFHDYSESEEVFITREALNIVCEVAELNEAKREGRLDALCDKKEGMLALFLRPLTCKEEEYADIIIRALDQCRRLEIDIERAVEIKHAYNRSRPKKHGKPHA